MVKPTAPQDPEMTFSVTVDDEKKLVISKVRGVLKGRKTAEMGKSCRLKAKQLGYSLILDFRDTQITIGIAETFSWFKDHYSKDESSLRLVKTAHLYSPNQERLFEFVQLSWQNQGILTRAFRDRDAAISWLRGN
jgi:hypothetical protein